MLVKYFSLKKKKNISLFTKLNLLSLHATLLDWHWNVSVVSDFTKYKNLQYLKFFLLHTKYSEI